MTQPAIHDDKPETPATETPVTPAAETPTPEAADVPANESENATVNAASAVPVIEFGKDLATVNPLARFDSQILIVLQYGNGNDGTTFGTVLVRPDGAADATPEWVNPGKRYFEKIARIIDTHGGNGKVHVRATVTKTDAGRYVLA